MHFYLHILYMYAFWANCGFSHLVSLGIQAVKPSSLLLGRCNLVFNIQPCMFQHVRWMCSRPSGNTGACFDPTCNVALPVFSQICVDPKDNSKKSPDQGKPGTLFTHLTSDSTIYWFSNPPKRYT